ncbi:MAG: GNAT family N-acetyltransferase [Haliea sp.]|jgi:predicted GNAT family N-acyltransferase|nr:GNAT family N-acetyltransferase [Haliea sp.]
MPHLRRASFAGDDEVSIRAIRTTVFCEEQGVDPAIDFDGNDASAIHVLVSCIGEPVATGRVLQDGHIGRIAVLRKHRKTGVGEKVVLALVEAARQAGCTRVFLGSQLHATGFYARLGFSPYGNEYVEAGIGHIHMELTLE